MTPPPRWTPDFRSEAANKLAELFPEVLADGKIDLEALKTLLAEDAAEPSERFGLFWPGKARAIQAAQTPTSATLAPDRENSVDWDSTQNVFIEGDNLEVLKILQKHYYGQIKMIYIDPPYNTGKDFVYKDDYSDPLGSYLKMTGQADGEGRLSTNTESDGRFHSNWLNMMYPRLKLAKNLLREDGAIAISINDAEVSNLYSVAKEIFGEQNIISLLPRKGSGGRQDSTHFAKIHEYVLIIAKSINSVNTGGLNTEGSQGRFVDETGRRYSRQLLRKWGDNARKVDRPNLFYPITAPDGSDLFPMLTPSEEGCWRWSKTRMEEAIQQNRVEFEQHEGYWVAYERMFDDERKSTMKYSTWIDNAASSGSKEVKELFDGIKIFNYPKPIKLISLLVKMLSVRENDLVLDFFAGSGTTAHAVMALNAEDGENRRCISVQLPEPPEEKSAALKAGYRTISEVTRERIRRAGQKIKNEEANKLENREEPLDTGFRAYKLTDSSFTRWNLSSDISEESLQEQLQLQAGSSEDHATPESKLTELLLRLGLSLTEKIETVSISDLEVFSVADGLLLAYTQEEVKPSLEQLRALVAAQPAKLVVLEDSFKGDDELKTNLTQECRAHGVDLYTA